MESSPRSRTLSIIIPCYNEAATIADVVARTKTAPLPSGWQKQIIVVDDGSDEATVNAVSSLESEITVVYRKKNGGKGAAVKDGLRVAKGDYCIIQDADLELDPNQHADLLAPIVRGDAEVVFGYRVIPKTETANPLLFLGGKLLSAFYNLLFGTRLRDIPCCYKVFPKACIPELLQTPSADFVFDAVELTRVISRGRNVMQVPVLYTPRTRAEGKKLFLRHGLFCTLAILLMRVGLHHNPVDKELTRLLRYLVSGVTTVLVNVAVLFTLTEYGHIWYLISAIVAFVVSYCVNFSLHKFWTFESPDISRIQHELPRHLILAMANLFINTALLFVLVEYGHVWYVGAQIIAAIVIALESFFLLSHFVFTSKKSLSFPLKNIRVHALALGCVFGLTVLLNSVPYFIAGISPTYNQSSDATVHVVQWQEFSSTYNGAFEKDIMFQNYQGQPTGTLFVDRLLVHIGEFFHIHLLDWSIIISGLSLALFLAGVYALALYSTKKVLLAFAITLASAVPTITLGLSSWGFLVQGFVPKETSLAIAVWLALVYAVGVSRGSKRTIALFFALLGLVSNWYPVLFFHFALVAITAEVLRTRSIRPEQFLYGIIFLVAAPLSLYDIFVKAAKFTAPVTAIIDAHYSATLHSWSYLFVHYLRKQIIFGVLIAVLWYLYTRVFKKMYSPILLLWFALWWAALLWSLLGVGVEIFYPTYMKYLLSRTSLWFYAASMVLVSYTSYQLYSLTFQKTVRNTLIFFCCLLIVLFSQTSIVGVVSGFRGFIADAPHYRDYLSVITKLSETIPVGALVLSNPDTEALSIRAYGGVGSYVSWKDGNVTLFDGKTATLWFDRYNETKTVFEKQSYEAIASYAKAHGLQYYLFNREDIQTGTTTLEKDTVLQDGSYGLAHIK